VPKKGRIYTLTSAAIPRLADGSRDLTEAEVVYKCLEPYGSNHSLEQLIRAAEYRKIETLFTSSTNTVRACLLYHLNRFKKRGIVRMVE